MEASRTERPGSRWATFAAMMILLAGTFNVKEQFDRAKARLPG